MQERIKIDKDRLLVFVRTIQAIVNNENQEGKTQNQEHTFTLAIALYDILKKIPEFGKLENVEDWIENDLGKFFSSSSMSGIDFNGIEILRDYQPSIDFLLRPEVKTALRMMIAAQIAGEEKAYMVAQQFIEKYLQYWETDSYKESEISISIDKVVLLIQRLMNLKYSARKEQKKLFEGLFLVFEKIVELTDVKTVSGYEKISTIFRQEKENFVGGYGILFTQVLVDNSLYAITQKEITLLEEIVDLADIDVKSSLILRYIEQYLQ